MKRSMKVVWAAFLILSMAPTVAADNVFQTGLKSYLKGDVDQSLIIWEKLAYKGDVQSQKQLGHVYYERGDLKDYDKSLFWYKKAIAQGDKDAEGKMQRVKQEQNEWQAIADQFGRQAASATIRLRANLHEGVMTHCGLVIEARSKIVYIQTREQPRWYLKDDLYAPDVKQCEVSV